MNDGRLKIRAANRAAAEEIVQAITGSEAGSSSIKCSIMKARLPRIKIEGIPQAWDAAKVKEVMMGMMHGYKVTQTVTPEILPLFKTGRRNAMTTQWILAVDTQTRKTLVDMRTIRHSILQFLVTDYLDQPRCYKCQRFGHLARGCPSEKPICKWCAGSGHTESECKNKSSSPICNNCKIARRRSDHPASDPNCQSYLNFIASLIKRSGYG